MTSPRARLLAILKEPDRYGVSTVADLPSHQWEAALAEKNASYRLKRLSEVYASVCSERAKEWADSYGDGSKDWAKRSMISAAEADRCAAAILDLGEDNEHS